MSIATSTRKHPVHYKTLRLRPLDLDAIADEQREVVRAELDGLTGVERVEATVPMIRAAEARLAGSARDVFDAPDSLVELEPWEQEMGMDALLKSLGVSYSIHEGYSAVWRAIGVSMTLFKGQRTDALKARAAGEEITVHQDAHLKIDRLAPVVARAKAYRAAAVDERDYGMIALMVEDGMRRDDAAAAGGIGGARLSNIRKARRKARERAEAKVAA
jgi:hypothetical protein